MDRAVERALDGVALGRRIVDALAAALRRPFLRDQPLKIGDANTRRDALGVATSHDCQDHPMTQRQLRGRLLGPFDYGRPDRPGVVHLDHPDFGSASPVLAS